MRKQDRLLALIKALSPAEKKYFVQNAKADGNAKSYLKLYEALLKKDLYNADELSDLLGKKKTDLANEKKYLEKVLMRSLRNYHEDNPKTKALNRMMDALILIDKNLAEQATVSTKQAIEIATNSEDFHLAWYANGLMLTLASEPLRTIKESETLARHHISQMAHCVRQLSLTTAFEELNFEVYYAYDKRMFDTNEEQRQETYAFINNPLLQADYEEASFLCQKYNLLALLYARLKDTENNLLVTEKWVAKYEESENIDMLGYWTAISCHTQATIATKDPERIENWINKLKSRYYHKLPVNAFEVDKLLEPYLHWQLATAHLKLLVSKKAILSKSHLFVDEFISSYDETKRKLIENHLISATVKTAACCLMLNRPEDCNKLLNQLFNDCDETVRPAFWSQAKLLLIMANETMSSHPTFPSLVQNASYYIKKTGQDGLVEKTMLQHFNKLHHIDSKADRKKWFRDFRASVNSLTENPATQIAMEQMPYEIWADMNLEEMG